MGLFSKNLGAVLHGLGGLGGVSERAPISHAARKVVNAFVLGKSARTGCQKGRGCAYESTGLQLLVKGTPIGLRDATNSKKIELCVRPVGRNALTRHAANALLRTLKAGVSIGRRALNPRAKRVADRGYEWRTTGRRSRAGVDWPECATVVVGGRIRQKAMKEFQASEGGATFGPPELKTLRAAFPKKRKKSKKGKNKAARKVSRKASKRSGKKSKK